MALKCTQQEKFQFSATEFRWGESGPVDITETWLASNERESQSQCGIGQDIIWICKFLLQWDDLKPFLLNSWCLNWLNDWCLVLGNSLYLVSLAVHQRSSTDLNGQFDRVRTTWHEKNRARLVSIWLGQIWKRSWGTIFSFRGVVPIISSLKYNHKWGCGVSCKCMVKLAGGYMPPFGSF